MEIQFNNGKLQKLCSSRKKLTQKYGPVNSKLVMRRLAQLEASETLADMSYFPQARCHPLKGDLKGKFAIDLKHPLRLIFVPNNDPLPRNDDGSLNFNKITKVLITDIDDYH